MSADFSAASADGNSASNEPECACSGTASPTPSASACSPLDGPASPAIRTCPSCGGLMLHPSTSSAAASPVRTSVVAGRGAGIGGARSGLWSEMFRLTGELRPGYLVVENVPALLVRGLDVVLGDLASIGFDAEWDCLRACDFGAPHERERLWLVAYPSQHDHVANRDGQGGRAADVADAKSNRCGQGWTWRPDPSRAREQQSALQAVASPDSEPTQRASVAWTERDPWAIEPDVARMAHGIPDGLDRRRALGNALIPQTSEWIGRRILAFEQERPA